MNILYTILESNRLTFKIFFVASVLLFASFSHAATLSVSPGTGVYTAGQTFTAKVIVNTEGASINASDGTLSFNPSEVSVVSVTKGPIFNLWTADPTFSNAKGSINFSGGSPTGYKGTNGVVISVTFRATSAGKPKVSFSSGSVLAADGKGTNVLTTMNGGAFTITAQDVVPEPETIEYIAPANTPPAPLITSKTHPDPTKWYTETGAELEWSLTDGVTGVRTLLDSNSGSIPTKVYDSPIKNISISDLEDGIQYFHIQFKNKDGWGRVTHYRLAVDTQKPTKFDISLAEGNNASNPVQTLKLTIEDSTSKVRRFLVQLDGTDPYEYIDEQGSSTLSLPQLLPGHHTAIIEAFDEAGNSIISTFSFTIESFDKPRFTEYPREINEQVIPVIKGITRPNAKVAVTLTQIGVGISSAYAVKTYEVQSNASGEFVFIPDGRLELGVYELKAIATDEFGAQSDVSDSIRIAVQIPGYIKIGSFMVSLLSVLIPSIALSVILFVGIWFVMIRLRLFRRRVGKEAKEAESILATEFGNLRLELLHQKTQLESSRKTKKLTKAEDELFTTLSNALTTSQKRVEKEIGDVEDLVE